MRAFPPHRRYWPVLSAFSLWPEHWIEARASELVEVARLGSGELEYLTVEEPPAVVHHAIGSEMDDRSDDGCKRGDGCRRPDRIVEPLTAA